MSNTSDLPAMESVTSSNISAVGHDGAALYIRFRGAGGSPGRLYKYPGVGRLHFDEMLGAVSPGGYFFDRIKHRHPGTLVNE